MTSSIHFLNELYHDYFLKNKNQVKADFKFLEKYLVDNRCTFKGVAMPTLLKPNFISQQQTALLKESVEKMSRALTKVITLYLSDDRQVLVLAVEFKKIFMNERAGELFPKKLKMLIENLLLTKDKIVRTKL